MDSIIVGIIVIAAVAFSVRSFIKIYKGEGGCSCEGGCNSCSSNGSCKPDFPLQIKNSDE
ncbi:MAG: FeoB-associated Cys-rich membrane protein [Desulfobacteraceae bacterium]|nr:FeoB-associated Cys-rich membrane protein [Desulfobacteraceae bacterium]